MTIYARVTGSDETGDGTSIATAYRTFQRAIRDVPHVIPPLTIYVIDLTDLGVETLPPDFAIPVSTASLEYAEDLDPASFPFLYMTSLNIRAKPRLFSGITPAAAVIEDADIDTITPDSTTGLIAIKLFSPRWTPGALKATMLEARGRFESGVIYDNTADTLFVCQNNVPTAPLRIVEPSCTLEGYGTLFNSDPVAAALTFKNIDSLAIQGIRVRNTIPGDPTQTAVRVLQATTLPMEFCDFDGMFISSVTYTTFFATSVFRSDGSRQFPLSVAEWYSVYSLYMGVQTWNWYAPTEFYLEACVLDGCSPPGPKDFLAGYSGSITHMSLLSTLITDSIPDAAYGYPAFGLYLQGNGTAVLQDVQINNAGADALRIEFGQPFVTLQNVRGSGNAGFGVSVDDGAMVRVLDDATDIGEDSGGMLVGNLGARTWADFRGVAPIKQQADFFAVTATGTRLFQKPA